MSRQNRSALVSVLAILSIVTFGTVVFMLLEEWTLIEALYFTIATITTVGYGDLHPTSDASRIAAIILLLLGVSTVLTSLSVLGTRYVRRQERILEKRIQNIAEHLPSIKNRK